MTEPKNNNTIARHCIQDSGRFKNTRMSNPVFKIFKLFVIWNVVGPSSRMIKNMQLLLTK